MFDRSPRSLLARCCCLVWIVGCSSEDGAPSEEVSTTGGASITGGVGAAPATGGYLATGGAVGLGGGAPLGGTGAMGNGPATGGIGAGVVVGGTGGFGPSGGAPVGGTSQTGGWTSTGGVGPTGGWVATGGFAQTGGWSSTGGGGTSPTGGASPTGGVGPTGGTGSTGGVGPTGGSSPTGGGPGTGGNGQTDCTFAVDSSLSPNIPTVGIVQWSTSLGNVSDANVVFSLNDAGDVLNQGGIAPVDPQADNRTLLLGLKGNRTYTFHIEASSADGTTCTSGDYELTTGATNGAPQINRTANNPSAQAGGFVITCGGMSSNMPAVIIDADGDVVWWAQAPGDCARARMDWEGNNVWMMSVNPQNWGGEVRRVSMDGTDTQNNLSGLSSAHHDLTVLPGGVVAVLAWTSSGTDVESDLLERAPNGQITTAFHVGSNLYNGGPSELGGGSNTYHANSINYRPGDDSYTIGDRNPELYVKVSRGGQLAWQFGGNCAGAPAPNCVSASWDANHGHHLLDNGNFIIFTNGPFMSSTPSRALEFSLNPSGGTANQVHAYTSSSNSHSDSLGDVQRLPNGNTLVVFSNGGRIEEVDASWNVVQVLTASSFAYADWRPTLYGPPVR